MQYSFGDKSFDRKLFDATKASLQQSLQSLSFANLPWLTLRQYGLFLRAYLKPAAIRSFQGNALPTQSIPLCRLDSTKLANSADHDDMPAPKTPPNDPNLFGAFDGNDAEWPKMDPREDFFSWAKEPTTPDASLPTPDAELAKGEAPDTPALPRRSPRVSTAALSTLLSLAAAISAGIIISNSDTFKLDGVANAPANTKLAEAGSKSSGSDAATRLALDSALSSQASFISAQREPAASRNAFVGASDSGRPAQSKVHGKHTADRERVALRKSAAGSQARGASSPARASPGKSRSATVTSDRVTHSVKKQAPLLQAMDSKSHAGTQYAKCDGVRGLLRREQCRWKACNGKWGKQGCPAYQHNARPEYGYGEFGQVGQSKTVLERRLQVRG